MERHNLLADYNTSLPGYGNRSGQLPRPSQEVDPTEHYGWQGHAPPSVAIDGLSSAADYAASEASSAEVHENYSFWFLARLPVALSLAAEVVSKLSESVTSFGLVSAPRPSVALILGRKVLSTKRSLPQVA